MTECVYPSKLTSFWSDVVPEPVRVIPVIERGSEALEEIKNYLKEEITNLPKSSESHLPKPMETIHEKDENSETEEVQAEKPENKKDGTSSDTKSSLIDFVLDKQKEELPPIGGGDDDS
jgi:hypothetical protein